MFLYFKKRESVMCQQDTLKGRYRHQVGPSSMENLAIHFLTIVTTEIFQSTGV